MNIHPVIIIIITTCRRACVAMWLRIHVCSGAHSKLNWEALGAKILQPATVNDSKLIHTSADVGAVNNDSVMMMLIELCFIKILVSTEAPPSHDERKSPWWCLSVNLDGARVVCRNLPLFVGIHHSRWWGNVWDSFRIKFHNTTCAPQCPFD